ncbi:MAG: hypothetical protein IKM16_03240, partial [Clostridia bacterium]|nr:hypothetical protein [Clostridia bacterium]
FAELGSLSFFAPDKEKFPALGLAYESLAKGGNIHETGTNVPIRL